MDLNFERYKLGYRKCSPPWECLVTDLKVKHEDLDKTIMKYYEGTYAMGPIISNCLLEKFPQDSLQKQEEPPLNSSKRKEKKLALDKHKYRSYCLLKNLRHSNIVTIENFYDENGQPRFVLSWVDGSLSAWLKTEGAGKIFKSSLRGSVPTGSLRQMIIDLCSGLEHLLSDGPYPSKIGIEDIYVRKLGNKWIAQLLITDAEELDGGVQVRKDKLWADMRNVLKDICKEAKAAIDPISLRFMDYIGVTDVTRLQHYPDNWTTREKAHYLFSIFADNISVVQPKVQGVGIEWPRTPKQRLRSPFYEMVKSEEIRRGRATYNESDPYDYLRLCKNMIKHWRTLPDSVKAECDRWEQIIDKMEKENSKIWCILYEVLCDKGRKL